MDKHKSAQSFLAYFPIWTKFSRAIEVHRDTTTKAGKAEEDHIVQLIRTLAYVVGMAADTLQGSYDAVQAGGRESIGDRDLLISKYIDVAKAYSPDPKKALAGIEGIDLP